MCGIVLPAGGVKQMAAVAAVGAVGGAVVGKLRTKSTSTGMKQRLVGQSIAKQIATQ